MKIIGDEVAIETNKQLKSELDEILLKNRKDFFKLSPRYWSYKNKYLAMTDSEIEILMNMEKAVEQIKALSKKGLNQIKWQRRFNTGKSCLKWGLLIFIAFKV